MILLVCELDLCRQVGPAANDVSFLSKRKTLTWNRYTFEISPEEYLIQQVSYMTAVIVEISAGALHPDDVSREAIKIVFFEAQLKLVRRVIANFLFFIDFYCTLSTVSIVCSRM
jgi:hypothetical protein